MFTHNRDVLSIFQFSILTYGENGERIGISTVAGIEIFSVGPDMNIGTTGKSFK